MMSSAELLSVIDGVFKEYEADTEMGLNFYSKYNDARHGLFVAVLAFVDVCAKRATGVPETELKSQNQNRSHVDGLYSYRNVLSSLLWRLSRRGGPLTSLQGGRERKFPCDRVYTVSNTISPAVTTLALQTPFL
jgi:hypothetical protein